MDTTDRTILKRFILGVVVILLIGVVIWVFFFRDDKKKTNTTDKTSNTSQQSDSEELSQAGRAAGTSATESQGNASRSGGSANAVTPSNNPGRQPTTLANTGPGDLAVLFVGSAAAGTLAHHLYSRRLKSRTNS